MSSLAPTLAMLAAFALAFAGAKLVRTPDRTRGILMIVMAVVLMANVVIWTL
jgi:VIT1/CCC1 family predicted Fe2+/Mn2+ transporter